MIVWDTLSMFVNRTAQNRMSKGISGAFYFPAAVGEVMSLPEQQLRN